MATNPTIMHYMKREKWKIPAACNFQEVRDSFFYTCLINKEIELQRSMKPWMIQEGCLNLLQFYIRVIQTCFYSSYSPSDIDILSLLLCILV
jgi:hypothetical protein